MSQEKKMIIIRSKEIFLEKDEPPFYLTIDEVISILFTQKEEGFTHIDFQAISNWSDGAELEINVYEGREETDGELEDRLEQEREINEIMEAAKRIAERIKLKELKQKYPDV